MVLDDGMHANLRHTYNKPVGFSQTQVTAQAQASVWDIWFSVHVTVQTRCGLKMILQQHATASLGPKLLFH